MEKVFDLHIHYLFEISLGETIAIFREEFSMTGTEKGCFLSLPHEAEKGQATFDEMQNLKGLYLKKAFSPNAYAFAGLCHPQNHDDVHKAAKNFLDQAREYLSNGFDGIKMLEGYPSLMKAWDLPIDSPVYDLFYAFMEENGYPIIMHVANPEENWDMEEASIYAIEQGRIYDDSYPKKSEITAQVFRIMDKFPKLKLILAHFGFMSYDIAEAERFMSYPHTMFDLTPGGEQLINMQKSWAKWLPFWEKYQDRIFYGTDFYAFPKDENWETAVLRRPMFLRQFLESNSKHLYLDEEFVGISLSKGMRDKIYRENFLNLLQTPKAINVEYMRKEAHRLLDLDSKKSAYANNDLEYILKNLESTHEKD